MTKDDVLVVGRWLLGAATLLGLGAAIAGLDATRLERSLIIAAMAQAVALAIALRMLHSTNARAETARRELEQLVQDNDLPSAGPNTLALYRYLRASPTADKEHRYSTIRESYTVVDDDATYEFQLNGERAVKGTTDVLRLKVTGDAPVDSDRLMATAYDRKLDESLPVRFEQDDSHLKVLAVTLRDPIPEGGDFSIELSFHWPGTFPRSVRQDYLFSAWGDWAELGVAKVEGKLDIDVPVINARLQLADGHDWQVVQTPKMNSGRKLLTWSLNAPTDVYLLTFEKELP